MSAYYSICLAPPGAAPRDTSSPDFCGGLPSTHQPSIPPNPSFPLHSVVSSCSSARSQIPATREPGPTVASRRSWPPRCPCPACTTAPVISFISSLVGGRTMAWSTRSTVATRDGGATTCGRFYLQASRGLRAPLSTSLVTRSAETRAASFSSCWLKIFSWGTIHPPTG